MLGNGIICPADQPPLAPPTLAVRALVESRALEEKRELADLASLHLSAERRPAHGTLPAPPVSPPLGLLRRPRL